MPNLFTTLPGQWMGRDAARHVMAQVARADLSNALLLLPTRRACGLMRQEFIDLMDEGAALLPRMLALADIGQEMPLFCRNSQELAALLAIPPAMPEWQRLSLLTRQVLAFEKQRRGVTPLSHALKLAQDLAALQDRCAQHGVALTPESLRTITGGDDAQHWQSALDFLNILSRHWPSIEAAYGMIAAASRQTQLLQLLAAFWRASPPDFPVFVIGSTGSQAPTAALMQVVAEAPRGAVMLPGFDPRIGDAEWAAIGSGHSYHHMKQFLARWPVERTDVKIIGDAPTPSIWLHALTPTSRVAHWRDAKPLTPDAVAHLKLVACAHDEEEVRVATILIREALETPGKRVALVTPDEQFMGRVAAHLQRYGVVADRLSRGTLGHTQTGSFWLALLAAIAEPERMMAQFALLRHPLVMRAGGANTSEWTHWLADAERYFRGVMLHTVGQLPNMPDALQQAAPYEIVATAIRAMGDVSRKRMKTSQWAAALDEITAGLQVAAGEGADAVRAQLDALATADDMGAMDVDGFASLLQLALSEPWRGDLHDTHPQVSMLTPIEARLQRFDRIILANLRDDLWPGAARPGAWLNFTHQQSLGLPSPSDAVSLMAHDVLLLGSAPEVILTYARRDAGSPATRSRFIERLLALLALHSVAEMALDASHYLELARALDAAAEYQPELPARPVPIASERPAEIAVTALDYLFSDPFYLYARYVLQLRERDDFDELPEARDFGTIAHRAIEQLSTHWNEAARPATEAELAAIADACLKKFSARATIRLFWAAQLRRALAFVNAQEIARRSNAVQVQNEVGIKETIRLTATDTAHASEISLTLHGRIDRLERDADGRATIGDYKTGAPPSENDVVNGKAVQLLAYALMLELSGTRVAAVDYWGLPSGKRDGKISAVAGEVIDNAELLEKLRRALATFMQPTTPLLARPVPTSQASRYHNPYDGISRYDEWAE